MVRKDSIFKDFTRLYPVTKTLRFELKPVDENGENKETGEVMDALIAEDDKRQGDIDVMKDVLNILHRNFIKNRLGEVQIKEKDLQELFKNSKEYKKDFEALKKTDEYNAKNTEDKKIARQGLDSFKKMYGIGTENRDILKEIRSSIESAFKKKDSEYGDGFNTLIKTEKLKKKIENIFGTNDINQFTEEQRSVVKDFNFYGALGDYAKNRENYYANKGKSTEIIHRVVTVNLLDKYIGNITLFEGESAYKEIVKEYKGEDLFKIENYGNYLLQENITAYNTHIGEINKKVNEENQRRKGEKDKQPRLKRFKELHKQIGSEQIRKRAYDIKVIENPKELLTVLEDVQGEIDGYVKQAGDYFKKLMKGIQEHPAEYFISKRKISGFSGNMLGNGSWNFFRGLLGKGEYVSFESIKEYLDSDDVDIDDIKKKTSLHRQKWFDENEDINTMLMSSIKKRFDILINGGSVNEYSKEERKFVANSFHSLEELKEKFNRQVEVLQEKLSEKQGKFSNKEKKEFIDSVQSIVFQLVTIDRFLRNFEIRDEIKDGEISNEDSDFYNKFHDEFLFSEDVPRWHRTLDSLRNYLTKNGLDDVNKIRLWFGKPDLLKKQAALSNGFFVVKNEDKYLAVPRVGMGKGKLEKFLDETTTNHSRYQLLKTTQMRWDTLCAGYKKRYKKNFKVKSGSKEMLNEMKKYMKALSKKYPKLLSVVNDSNISSTEELHKKTDAVFKELYGLSLKSLSKDFLEAVKEERIFLFKITSRDLRGKNADLQSIFFNYLFSEENLEKAVIKMGGNGMVFFREPTDELMREEKNPIETESGKVIAYKNGNGDEVYHKKRFYEQKMFVHFPVELNTGVDKKDPGKKVLETIKNSKEVKVLGIDRGENNLLYYYLLDREGRGKGDSLNELKYKTNKGDTKTKDFHALLLERENERQKARQRWSAKIPDIKNLKKGYLSWVLREIADFAVKENAIIVLEGLNKGFIGGRRHIEKNVYSQFQKGLVDKLNFLMTDNDPENALQLTPNITSYSDIEKGNNKGILFFVMPSYTSVTCPNCGWRNRRRINYKSVKKSIDEFKDIQINWEKKESRFQFSFTIDKIKDEIYSDVDRYFYNKEEHGYTKKGGKKITEELQDLFNEHGVDIESDITERIRGFNGKDKKAFWETLINLFNMITQIRNKTGEGDDFILCPSCHFDTRNGKGRLKNGSEIKNGDSNGAYNIARRGLMFLDKIDKQKSPNLSLKLVDWDKHVRKQNDEE